MSTHVSATALEETPHETETTQITISDELRRRAQSVINDRIVTGKAADEVTEEVNNLLEAGWKLRGDFQMGTSEDPHGASVYSQAMIKEEYSEYAGIDYNLSVQIDDLDSIRHSLDKIAEALDTAASSLIQLAKTLPPPE